VVVEVLGHLVVHLILVRLDRLPPLWSLVPILVIVHFGQNNN